MKFQKSILILQNYLTLQEQKLITLLIQSWLKLIENLSKYLTDTFGKGFSEANLKNMRQFYVAYPEFDRQCLANLSWSNITRILRIDNPKDCIAI